MTPRRRLQPGNIILASHNAGKLAELEAWLRPFGMKPLRAPELRLPEPEETGADFAENAAIKAKAAAQRGGHPALGDDSGLEVDALDGQPGIFSARWAGPQRDFAAAMDKVLQGLQRQPGRGRAARFVCALALAWPDGHCETFTGAAEGEIAERPLGDRGFGYDPIFRPQGFAQSFAEMEPAQKQALSHRSKALDALAHACLPPRPRA